MEIIYRFLYRQYRPWFTYNVVMVLASD